MKTQNLNIHAIEYVCNNNPNPDTYNELVIGLNYYSIERIMDVDDIAQMIAIGDFLTGGYKYENLGKKFLAAPILSEYLNENEYDATDYAAYIIEKLTEEETMRCFNYE
jgi:diphthamide synthase subunit DPH2